jgi:alkylation response protein AidB-like acyl-CoA dehydrogenase
LSDEQRLFGRTAAEFMRNEVVPHEASLYAHDWTKTRELLKKAADLDLLRLEITQRWRSDGLQPDLDGATCRFRRHVLLSTLAGRA